MLLLFIKAIVYKVLELLSNENYIDYSASYMNTNNDAKATEIDNSIQIINKVNDDDYINRTKCFMGSLWFGLIASIVLGKIINIYCNLSMFDEMLEK